MHNIIHHAISVGNHKTMADALTAAGQLYMLKGIGPFTVLAITFVDTEKMPK